MKKTELKLHLCYCGGEMEIKKVAHNGGMDGTYWDWKLTCNKCGLTKYYAADGFYGRKYKTFEEVVDDWNRKKEKEVIQFIKDNFSSVEGKPGYVWFNKRNAQIINLETLARILIKDGCGKIQSDADLNKELININRLRNMEIKFDFDEENEQIDFIRPKKSIPVKLTVDGDCISRQVEDAYNKGLNDAWECVRKIIEDKSMAEWVTLCNFFGVNRNDFFEIFKKYSASEVIEKMKKYDVGTDDDCLEIIDKHMAESEG